MTHIRNIAAAEDVLIIPQIVQHIKNIYELMLNFIRAQVEHIYMSIYMYMLCIYYNASDIPIQPGYLILGNLYASCNNFAIF